MGTVRYDGPSDAVEVTDPQTGAVYVVARGATAELPDKLAKALLEQSIWTDPDASTKDDTSSPARRRTKPKQEG